MGRVCIRFERMEKYLSELEETDKSDITTHKYEGGFKIWECTIDLCEFIEKHAEHFNSKRVLELGCGAALPSILTAIHGASRIVVQDFNPSVIDLFTLPNFEVNKDKWKTEVEISGWAGCWVEMAEKAGQEKFDVILSSETIYNEEDYPSLHDAMVACLAPNGVAWFAAKFFYFGVGGNVPTFCDYINKRNRLEAAEIEVIDASVPRRIVEIRWRSSQ